MPSYECNLHKNFKRGEEGGYKDDGKNTLDAPKWLVRRTNAFQAAFHVLTLVESMVVHPAIQFGADRALPECS